jgi:hypothetical protein
MAVAPASGKTAKIRQKRSIASDNNDRVHYTLKGYHEQGNTKQY